MSDHVAFYYFFLYNCYCCHVTHQAILLIYALCFLSYFVSVCLMWILYLVFHVLIFPDCFHLISPPPCVSITSASSSVLCQGVLHSKVHAL